jgi:YhcN/YlaJ family sporulation lipoprotein
MKNKFFKVSLAVFLVACTLAITFVGCAQPDKNQQNQTELFPERDVPGVPGENMGTTPRPGNRNLLNDSLPNNSLRSEEKTPQANDGRNVTGLDDQTPMQEASFDKERADKIVNQLNKIEGIDEINAIVNGNTAVVVYTLKNTKNTEDNIDSMIEEKVKNADKSITKVEISHSDSAMTKIKELTNNIRENKPVEELNNIFEQLMRTINPRS